MPVGDVVVLRFSDLTVGRPRMRGVVVAVPGGGLSSVLWENGKLTSSLDDTILREEFDPTTVSQAFADLVGKWMQLDDWPTTAGSGGADSTPKSPAASGLARRVYGIGAIGAGSPATALLNMEVLDGAAELEVVGDPPPATEQPGRRSVRGA